MMYIDFGGDYSTLYTPKRVNFTDVIFKTTFK